MTDVWFVTNGYRGNGYVTAIVTADNEDDALARAREALRRDNERLPEQHRYDGQWLCDLKAERITLPYVTEIG